MGSKNRALSNLVDTGGDVKEEHLDNVPSSLEGPQGPPGADGADGAIGPIGPTGMRGLVGRRGPDGRGVPSGGLTSEVLVKSSDSDYDTEWTDTLDEITMNGGYF